MGTFFLVFLANERYDRMIKDALMEGSSYEAAVAASGPIVVTPTSPESNSNSSNGTTTSGPANGTVEGPSTNSALQVVLQDGGEDSVFVIPSEG